MAAFFITLALLLFLGISWQRNKRKRKALEDEYLK
jgi:hypothetical protein